MNFQQSVLHRALGVFCLLGILAGCGSGDPLNKVRDGRSEFEEIVFQGSVPDKEGGRLLVQVLLERRGKGDLETLTVRVEQRNERGGVLRVDHVPLDVADIRPYEAKEIAFQVPLSEAGEVRQLVVKVEGERQPGVTYPEFEAALEGADQ